ncbi:MAG TPA: FtsX-like permease family protein [Vicinamibacteria bacterium]|jgi:lipoprotein-releasing system permease protein
MSWELRVALRYLTARRKQAFVSVISAVAVLGVSIGVMAVLIALGLMTGLQSEIRSRILGATAHLSLFRTPGATLDELAAVLETVRRVPGVAGAARSVYGKALVSTPTGAAAVTLKGIVPAEERTVTEVVSKLVSGSADELGAPPGDGMPPILVGSALADTLNVSVGDVVTILSAQGRLSPFGMLPMPKRARVVGTVKTGLYEFDATWGYLPVEAARRILDMEGRTAHIEVRLDDIFAVKRKAREILEALGGDYVSTDWIEMNQALYSALYIEKVAVGIAIGLIVAVAALNIVVTLVLMVMEKHKDIAILVSMGASRRSIMGVFMLQGAVIGLIGTAIGGFLGIGACYVLDRFRVVRVPESVYQIAWVPFRLQTGDALVVLGFALLICFLATLYPSRGAARLDPAEALRYE